MQAALAAQAQHQQQQQHHRAKNSPMALFNGAGNPLNGVVGGNSPGAAGNSFHGHHHMNGLTNGGGMGGEANRSKFEASFGQSPGPHLNGHSHQIPVTSANGALVNGYGTPNGHLLPVSNSGSPAGGYGGHHFGSSQGQSGAFYPNAANQQHPFGQHHVVGGSPTAHLFGSGAKYVSGGHNQLGSLQQQSQQAPRSSLNAHAAAAAAAAASLNGSGTFRSLASGSAFVNGSGGSANNSNSKVLAGFLQQSVSLSKAQQQQLNSSSQSQQSVAQQQASFARGLQTAFNLAAVPFTPSTTSSGSGGNGSPSSNGGSSSPAAGASSNGGAYPWNPVTKSIVKA